MAAKSYKTSPSGPAAPQGSFYQRNRREVNFLVIFLVLLAVGFTLISVNWVNAHVIEPFTAGIAKTSGATLNLLGQKVTMRGTEIHSSKFAVNIRNGCNGVEAMLIFLAAVVAFPARWKPKLAGLALGFLAIQLVNLIRVVALFLTGIYFPKVFDTSHTVVWQTIVILFAVLLWIFWANRFAHPATPSSQEG